MSFMSAIIDTAEREECVTHYEPQTVYTTQYADRGGYVDQVQMQPGAVRNELTWQAAACVVDPRVRERRTRPGRGLVDAHVVGVHRCRAPVRDDRRGLVRVPVLHVVLIELHRLRADRAAR